MKAYLMRDIGPDEDPREENRLGSSAAEPSPVDLASLGVLHEKIPLDSGWNRKLQERMNEWKLVNSDVVKISPEWMPNYQEKLGIFFEEHLHTDSEVRYIMDGSGYFDVRNKQDRWLRIPVSIGDLLYLPAGIYHRFTTDKKDYLVAMRLFESAPCWEAKNRSDPATEGLEERSRYIKDHLSK